MLQGKWGAVHCDLNIPTLSQNWGRTSTKCRWLQIVSYAGVMLHSGNGTKEICQTGSRELGVVSRWHSAVGSMRPHRCSCSTCPNVQMSVNQFLQTCGFAAKMLNYHMKLYIYEDKVKSSRPSLREIRDKRPLCRDPDRSWCHRHTKSMIKLFVAVHGIMGIGGSIWARWKLLGLAYNRRKLLVAAHAFTEWAAAHRMLPPISMEPWAATKQIEMVCA